MKTIFIIKKLGHKDIKFGYSVDSYEDFKSAIDKWSSAYLGTIGGKKNLVGCPPIGTIQIQRSDGSLSQDFNYEGFSERYEYIKKEYDKICENLPDKKSKNKDDSVSLYYDRHNPPPLPYLKGPTTAELAQKYPQFFRGNQDIDLDKANAEIFAHEDDKSIDSKTKKNERLAMLKKQNKEKSNHLGKERR